MSPTDLIKIASGYLSPEDVGSIQRAYEFAVQAHRGQKRFSGESYIQHPLAAAIILAELGLDARAIMGALLHDVAEDAGVSLNDIEKQFGREVTQLVDGVTKLSKMKRVPSVSGNGQFEEEKRGSEAQQAWAESMRKLFLAMAEDLRVVLIKLADRLHNMRTLQHVPVERQKPIAQETMDIYAPLASRLGIWQIKWQLEDLAFRYLEPQKYREISRQVTATRKAREEYIARVVALLEKELSANGIQAEITGRPKHVYSIYRKMQARGTQISQIYDLLAVRVLVREMQECYGALGIVHSLWHPIPGQFDDYIATPKESLYRSLHTSVMGPDARPLEIQIRTYEMHQLAEYGVAAHWHYKEGGKRDEKFDSKVAWLRQLMEWQKEMVQNAQEFVDTLKTDIFRDQVYIFTPKGEIRELPAGATPIDFAYRIHTEVGHRCVGSKVNGRLVRLDYPLRNGDIVEIVTTRAPRGPSRDWLNPALGYVKTAHARDKIRQWFRKQEREENIVRGRELLDKELRRLGVANVKLEELAQSFRFDRLEDFLAAVGYGDINTQQIATKVAGSIPQEQSIPAAPAPGALSPAGVTVQGVGDLLTRLANCCNPLPGDKIMGYITRGRGVTIHRADCPSILGEDETQRLMAAEWGRAEKQRFPVVVRIDAWDREGLLRDVATVIADEKISISGMNAQVRPDRSVAVTCSFDVEGLSHLSKVMSRIEMVRDVFNVVREVPGHAAPSPSRP